MTRPGSTPAIVVALHDGFCSFGTGAGSANRAFLTALTQMIAPRVRLVVLPVGLVPASTEYDPDWHAEMQALIKAAGGEVFPVDNGTGGYVRFGGVAAFRQASGSAAEVIRHEVLPHASQLLIVAFDTPFYGLAGQLPPPVRPAVVAVVRSTAALHAPGDSARVIWDRDGLHATAAAGGRIAAISAHMRRHLAEEYRIPDSVLIDLPDGVTSGEWQHTAPPGMALLPAQARAGFLLAMGRAHPYKGFDDLLDAVALLKAGQVRVPHVVVAAVTEAIEPSAYQRHLAQRIRNGQLNATLITRFAPALRTLLAHPALAAVVVPSRVEPFGRIPLEAFIAGAAPVVATTAGGLAELVTDGHTGYTASPADPRSLASAIHRALSADTATRSRLQAAGRHLAATRFNHDRAVREFLSAQAPWAIRRQVRPAQPAIRLTITASVRIPRRLRRASRNTPEHLGGPGS
jgi:glycosyltransferase involved in cell wall biosynthesis